VHPAPRRLYFAALNNLDEAIARLEETMAYPKTKGIGDRSRIDMAEPSEPWKGLLPRSLAGVPLYTGTYRA
jgi:hypothetical protein